MLHKQPVHVVYTDYRPTPLQHFIFPVGGEGLYEVVNIQGQFREDKFAQAMSGLAAVGDKAAGGVQRGRKGGMKTDSNVVKIIRTIKERDMLPCIIFSFSRKECEAYALSLKDMDFNDGEWITSGEYIQMSGRAGRRGKDDRGLVILMVDHKMSSEDAKQIIKGATDPLNSQFRLTYNMVLNLLRVEGVNPEFMLERSFYQFQNYDAIPELQRRKNPRLYDISSQTATAASKASKKRN
ncbi:hypothetical protein TELCIR_12060 [Teladorsagia circumcincta]|uniref:Exosome RNA helicase MTR4-like stalk domain-containing protein n=1 Tax=Teladorsagia circumcincta TaxID=45464 RepID=A0A2G9U9S2_TELCI|nr:hypothetical protein TELCIR_12060 [Teladorsagia circumcincta]